MRYLDRDSNSMTISAFYELHLLNKFNYDPPCQRKSVWGETQKSFLIDSILKNFPIPPIFLYRKIDGETGRESYDVIDGKQRLLAIISFIENQISLPDDFGDGVFGEEKLNGKYFNDLNEEKSILWKYKITIEYVESDKIDIINSIFDRLNRNGVKLNPQELRNAKYNASALYRHILELKEYTFWKNALKDSINSNRLEDEEFISDILFFTQNLEIINSSKQNLDSLYEKYTSEEEISIDTINKFKLASDILNEINIGINKYKVYGVSHLYTLWNLVIYCIDQDINILEIQDNINEFYEKFRNGEQDTDEYVKRYKEGMARDVKSKTRRNLRFNAIKEFLGI